MVLLLVLLVLLVLVLLLVLLGRAENPETYMGEETTGDVYAGCHPTAHLIVTTAGSVATSY
jgi:hypothetical protein